MAVKLYAIIVVIAFLVMGGLSLGGISPLSLAPLDFDTDTKTYTPKDFSFRGWYAGETELLDGGRYIVGPSPEKVVFEGMAKKALNLRCIRDSEFRVFATTGSSWGSPVKIINLGGISTNPISYTPTGSRIYAELPSYSGYLKVELWIRSMDFCGTLNNDEGWHLAIKDAAHIKSGAGSVEFDRRQYEVGDTAVVTLKLGFAQSSKMDSPQSGIWTFELFSYAQNRAVHSETFSGPDPYGDDDILQTTIQYTIQRSDFRLTESCSIAGALNKMTATIFNSLVETDSMDATTIDLAELGPPKPSLNVNKAKFVIGEGMDVGISTSENSETQLEVCGVSLLIAYDNPITELVDVNLDIDGSGKAYYTISALPSRGLIRIEAYAWDAAGRPSDISVLFVEVVDPGEPADQIPWFIFAVLGITLVLALLILFIPFIPPQARIVISASALGIALWIMFFWWALPAIMNWWFSIKPGWL